MSKRVKNCGALFILFLLGLSPRLHAGAQQPAPSDQKCLRQVCVPFKRTIAGTSTELKGLEKFTYWGFDLYTAALYAPAGITTSAQILGDTPKSLVLYYHRKIRNDQIVTAGDHNLWKNPENLRSSLETPLKKFNAAYQTVDKNDRYELLYEPGKGTTLLFNDVPKVTVPGVDFQRAYFGIWLSQYPINAKLRDRLLGQK